MKESVGIIVAAVIALYANWTSVGIDNERLDLDQIRNSRGFLIRLGAEQ
jgi:hypothetical protein